MVRLPGLRLRDELLELQRNDGLKDASGLIVSGDMGTGKSATLNYAIACAHQAGWLVAVLPNAADWTLGIGGKSCQAPNEAYRVTDPATFSQIPPELADSPLYEAPDATANFAISFLLSQRAKLEKILIKDPHRIAHYSSQAATPGADPTLADILLPYVRDEAGGFSDFPVPLRPVYDLLQELQLVTEFPVLLVVDNFNRWQEMASSKEWKSETPLHAQQLLVPSLLEDVDSFSRGMANGLMLCGLTHQRNKPPKVPFELRKVMPPPYDWFSVGRLPVQKKKRKLVHPIDWARVGSVPAEIQRKLRHVGVYSPNELQRALELYAHVGRISNRGLEAQLRTGELCRKVAMLTAGNGADVFKICDAM